MTPQDNPDHYKYMPRRTDDPVEIEEIVTVVKEPVLESEVQAESTQPPKEVKNEEINLPWGVQTVCKGILKFFYDFFNPLLIPAYATILIFELSVLAIIVPKGAPSYTLTVCGATCVIPLFALFILRRLGSISSIGLELKSDRVFPYVIEILALGGMTLFFLFKGASPWIWLIYCGATITVFLNLLINFRLRISCHCSAIAALLAVLIAINGDGIPHASLGWWAIGAVIVAGFIGSGAIILGRHRLSEVVLGYATGFLPIILLTLIR